MEAVYAGEIKRLVVNIPFRSAKSSLVSVLAPAWRWIHNPTHKFLCGSYALKLSVRDNVKMRRLLASRWYRERWGDRFSLTGDQNQKIRFDNDKAGFRIAFGFESVPTGDGADTVQIDDPHNTAQANSDTERTSALEDFDQGVITRLNQPAFSQIVLVMQRLHRQDLSGHVLEQEGWDHLMIPMRYEPDHPYLSVTSLGWQDPRTEPGELMWPERFPEKTLHALESTMGDYAVAGQLQQRPSPAGGGIFKDDWWQDWTQDAYPDCLFTLAAVDTAYGESEKADHSACTVWGVYEDPKTLRYRLILRHAWRKNLQFNDLVEKLEDTIRRQEVDKMIVEAKASGASIVQELRRRLKERRVSLEARQPPPGDKIGRAFAVQGILQSGFVSAPLNRAWADQVVSECSAFPNGRYKDLVDTVTLGLSYLRTRGLELYAEDDRPVTHARQREAFY